MAVDGPGVLAGSSDPTVEAATRLHADAHRACFIASSINFPVRHEPTLETSQ